MSAEQSDPFAPAAPEGDDLGRLFTHGTLAPGYQCRICRRYLSATPGAGLVCLRCDLMLGMTR